MNRRTFLLPLFIFTVFLIQAGDLIGKPLAQQENYRVAREAMDAQLYEIALKKTRHISTKELSPEDRDTLLFTKSEAHLGLNQAHEAIKILETSEKESSIKNILLARSYFTLKEYEKSLTFTEAVLASEEDLFLKKQAAFITSLTFLAKGNAKKSLLFLDQYDSFSQTANPSTLFLRVEILLQAGYPKQAKELLSQLPDEPPYLPLSQYLALWTASLLNEHEQVETLAQKILAGVTPLALQSATIQHLAGSYLAQDQTTKALELLSKNLHFLTETSYFKLLQKALLQEDQPEEWLDRFRQEAAKVKDSDLALELAFLSFYGKDLKSSLDELSKVFLANANAQNPNAKTLLIEAIAYCLHEQKLEAAKALSSLGNENHPSLSEIPEWLALSSQLAALDHEWETSFKLLKKLQAKNPSLSPPPLSWNLALASLHTERVISLKNSTELQNSEALEVAKILNLIKNNKEEEFENAAEAFLLNHPQGKWSTITRLATIKYYLSKTPIQIEKSLAQLNEISIAGIEEQDFLHLMDAQAAIAEVTRDYGPLIKLTQKAHLTQKFSHESIAFKLAEAYFHHGDYLKSLVIFDEIIATKEENNSTENLPTLRFLKARCQIAVGTEESKEEGLSSLRKILQETSIHTLEARLLLAKETFRAGQGEKALQLITEKATELSQEELSLAAEISYFLGKTDPKYYTESIEYLSELIKDQQLPLERLYQLYFLKGLTYEKLSDQHAANEQYLFVLQSSTPNGNNPKALQWVEKCGFQMISNLETNQNWIGAHQICKQLIKAGGPRAQEAQRKAKQLELEHMIWE